MNNKIKFYGLFDITQKQYTYAQSATAVILILLWVWAVLGNFNELLFGYGTIFLAIVTVAEAAETIVTFIKFRK